MIPEEPQHGDKVYFTTKATNGGYIRIRNYDYSTSRTDKHYYTGREVSHSAHFTFDFHDPYHCSARGNCTNVMLERGQAITKNGDITLRWSGWRDDDSGIGEYEYEVFKLRPYGDMLGMRGLSPVPGQTGRVGAATSQVNIHLTEPGVYSVVLTVEDGCGPNDGNFVITRRFLIYDDNSTVQADTSGHHPMWAESASNVTGRVWQTNLQDAMANGPQVAVSWPYHFCNQFQKHNKFLNAIEEHPSPILPGYEELTGQPPATRSREAIPNVNTILLFQTDWAVDHQGGRSLSSPPGNWQNVTDMTIQRQSRDVPREDGDTVRFWVRAYDVMNNFADNYVTIHVDSSPPVIEDIFLSRGGVDTLAVHHSQDLFEMTDLEKTSRKIADFRNHLRFSLRCLKVSITPTSLRLKTSIRGFNANKIIFNAERKLLNERVRQINYKLDGLNARKSNLEKLLREKLSDEIFAETKDSV
ncbi:uncharacterized protein LOC144916876 [Branchiostoma floridae x Branchiostoma belcheri]